MPAARRSRPVRKLPSHYHHGDLKRALLEAALRTIQCYGVGALTLRGVAKRVGVSQTALYRHFTDKSALLRAVAREGFRILSLTLVQAWEQGGRGRGGFEAMEEAYVKFAVDNPSHYRVMFGTSLTGDDPALAKAGADAFQILTDSLEEQQRDGLLVSDNPLQLARFVWALLHGISMLAIDGRLEHQNADVAELTRYAIERARTGTAAVAERGNGKASALTQSLLSSPLRATKT